MNPESSESRRFDLDEWRRRGRCKVRYGRAVLTVRRWGGLIGTELADTLNRYRNRTATSEEVAWAFVRTRVEGHSPSFSWADIDLGRLVERVASCSQVPVIEDTDFVTLAETLIDAQDAEIEALRRSTARLREQLRGITRNLSSPAFATLTRWTEQQSRIFEQLSRQLQQPSYTARLPPIRVPRIRLPPITIEPVRLPYEPYREASRSLARSMQALSLAARPAFQPLLERRALSPHDVIAATRAAARVADEQDEPDQARRLELVAHELAEVADDPAVERVERLLTTVVYELRATEARLVERESAAERRQVDRQAAAEQRQIERERAQADVNKGYFVLSIYTAILLFLLGLLFVPSAPSEGAPPEKSPASSQRDADA
jgi:hypothetical protein